MSLLYASMLVIRTCVCRVCAKGRSAHHQSNVESLHFFVSLLLLRSSHYRARPRIRLLSDRPPHYTSVLVTLFTFSVVLLEHRATLLPAHHSVSCARFDWPPSTARSTVPHRTATAECGRVKFPTAGPTGKSS